MICMQNDYVHEVECGMEENCVHLRDITITGTGFQHMQQEMGLVQ